MATSAVAEVAFALTKLAYYSNSPLPSRVGVSKHHFSSLVLSLWALLGLAPSRNNGVDSSA